MNIAFIGAPISGKTTTAARLFASLKDSGYTAEFIPEQARVHIALLRYEASRNGDAPRPLDDSDQLDIMRQQRMMERIFSTSSRTSFVITDCAAFLALLYMTPQARVNEYTLSKARASAAGFDLLFRCHPVQPPALLDPNRVHSFEESLKLDEQLSDIMTLAEVKPARVIELSGPSNVRASRAHYETLERALCRG